MFRMQDAERVLHELESLQINGKRITMEENSPWTISSGRRKRIERIYRDFSIESWYNIRILDREVIPGPSPVFRAMDVAGTGR